MKSSQLKSKNVKIVIYGETWCPFCTRAKSIAKRITNDFKFISGKTGTELKRILKLKTSPKTIPIVVVNGKYIGGFSELQSLYK